MFLVSFVFHFSIIFNVIFYFLALCNTVSCVWSNACMEQINSTVSACQMDSSPMQQQVLNLLKSSASQAGQAGMNAIQADIDFKNRTIQTALQALSNLFAYTGANGSVTVGGQFSGDASTKAMLANIKVMQEQFAKAADAAKNIAGTGSIQAAAAVKAYSDAVNSLRSQLVQASATVSSNIMTNIKKTATNIANQLLNGGLSGGGGGSVTIG